MCFDLYENLSGRAWARPAPLLRGAKTEEASRQMCRPKRSDDGEVLHIIFRRYGIMKRGLKGFAFLVSGLVLGIIGATASVTAIALSAVGMAKVRRANKN